MPLELLPADHAGLLRDFLHADVLVADLGQHACLGQAAAEVVAEMPPGTRVMTIITQMTRRIAAQDNLLEWAGLLQKLNHLYGNSRLISC